MIHRHPRVPLVAVIGIACSMAMAQKTGLSPEGRWQYLQTPDKEGEVLDLSRAGGRWRGVMNGLERTGDHGLLYYVVEVENLSVDADGSIRFDVGDRELFITRPTLSKTGGEGDGGVTRDRMHFKGRLEGEDLVLACEGDGGSCPDVFLRFKRTTGSREGG